MQQGRMGILSHQTGATVAQKRLVIAVYTRRWQGWLATRGRSQELRQKVWGSTV
jgi:hypothetical protein